MAKEGKVNLTSDRERGEGRGMPLSCKRRASSYLAIKQSSPASLAFRNTTLPTFPPVIRNMRRRDKARDVLLEDYQILITDNRKVREFIRQINMNRT